jgi:hypothetical protein
MDARDRFITALAELVNSTYYAQGFLYISAQDVEALARTHAVPDAEARAALRSLDDQGLLLRQEGGHSYSDGLGLALTHEESDRALFWRRNLLRREILRLAADAFDEGSNGLDWDEGDDHLIDTPWSEKFMAVQILAYLGLMEVRHASGTTLWAFITSTGYDLQREGRELARQLPTSAAEDETAGALVAPDALRDLILSVEDLLTKRNWHGAARELGRGDEQYRDGHWTDAVREYYAALESALKHRLDEAGAPHGEGAALKQLAGQAADNELVPVNYKAMFGFADSIRSPRSHGAGAKPSEVEVGRAEALLMSNHVRGLILYLGHRPR